MGPTQTRSRAARPRYPDHVGAVTAQRLDHLRDQIAQSIIDAAGGAGGELLNEIVVAGVGALVDYRNDPREAAAAIADLLGRLGEQHPSRTFDTDDLAAGFQGARVAAQKGLGLALGNLVTGDELIRLREDLVAYLVELHLHAHTSFVRAQRLQAMTPQQRRNRLGAMAFGVDETDDIAKLATAEGIDPLARLVAVVSISAVIPPELRQDPQALAGGSVREVLVPEEWVGGRLATQLAGQAVTCPAVTLAQATEAVTLARRAAELLRDGTICDARLIVPGADLLGDLVVGSDQLLAELIFDKHLSPFESMSASRRVTLGELTLGLLESGQPVDQVAKQLHIPRQTAHSRLKAIRSLLGDALHDPTQRLELIVALRAALPRWRRQLARQPVA